MDNKNRHSEPSDKLLSVMVLIPIFLGLFLALTSVREIIPSLGLYNGKRILELILIPLVLLITILRVDSRQKFNAILTLMPRWVRVLLVVFFSLGLISAFLTEHPAYPLLDVAMLFSMVVTIVSVACSRQLVGLPFDKLALGLLGFMAFGIFFQEIIGLLVYVGTDQQFNYREALIHFLHPRLYNQVQTWTIPVLSLFPLIFKKHSWIVALTVFLLGTQWYIILSTGARGTPISLIVAMLVIGIFFPFSRKYWVKLHISGLLLGVLFYVFVIGLLGEIQPEKNTFVLESIGRPMLHTSGRTDLWMHAINDAKENPWLGSGPMRFACGVDHHLPGSPHSFPIQILGEWGVPAFLSLIFVLIWLLYASVQTRKRIPQEKEYNQAIIACLAISIVATAIHINVSSLHIAPSSQVAGILIWGWFLGVLPNNNNKPTKRISPLYTNLVLLTGILISISVLVFSTAELDELPLRTSYASDYGPTTPRFWQDGRFCEYDHTNSASNE